jgi:hypothetical protein
MQIVFKERPEKVSCKDQGYVCVCAVYLVYLLNQF